MAAITVHPPSSSHSSLADAPGGFDRTWFMGKWGVCWSTLPMWKVCALRALPYFSESRSAHRTKKSTSLDVAITYSPVAAQSKISTTFDDLVEYRKRRHAHPLISVKGVDTLTVGANGATFDWKGAGYLFFVHSHWEVLGYGKDEENGLEWGATFFSKTLFTPAGIDIYLRSSPTDPKPTSTDHEIRANLVERIRAELIKVEEGGVGKLAAGGFEVPGVV
ncbi:hypothetical protein P7C73_g1958, partial [Tremellales sp. Uapishka_1]